MNNTRLKALLGAGIVALSLAITGCASNTMQSAADGPLILSGQGSFFVGGREVKSDLLSTIPNAFPTSGTITVDQMYVHYQTPAVVKGKSVVFIHGCCLSGKTWESTPDGRMGWDEFFVRKGFPTYVIDQSARGRSPADPTGIVGVRQGKSAADQLPQVFSLGHEGAWEIFRFGPKYPATFPGMQFPLDSQAEFWKQMTMDWSRALPNPNPTVPALSELAKKTRGAILVSHSQSGIYPFQTAALNREGIAGIVSIEPTSCPAPTGNMQPYKDMPILVLWGDFTELTASWTARVKACGEFVAAVNAAGGKAEMIKLADVGLPGNSHMLMQDKTSLKVAEWLSNWMTTRVPN